MTKMTQILSPFTVQLKHPWSPSPVWRTFWTETEAQAIAQATKNYTSLGGTPPEIIKAVALQPDQAIMPPKVRRHNASIVSRNRRNAQKSQKSRGFASKNPQITKKDSQ